MRKSMTLTLIATLAAAPLQAQTFDEAVKINLAAAVQLCAMPSISDFQRAAMFRAAGFAESVTRSTTNSDTTHIFTAPAETASAELYYGETAGFCGARTGHLGVTGASGVLDSLVPSLFPNFVRVLEQGPVDPATGQPAICVKYQDPSNPIGLEIGVVSNGPSGGCVPDGTSLVYTTYRV